MIFGEKCFLPLPTSNELIEYFSFQYGTDQIYKESFENISTSQNQQKDQIKNYLNLKQIRTQPPKLLDIKVSKLTLNQNKIKNKQKNSELKDKNQNFFFQQQPINRRKGYPTKNFLVHFKKLHLNFLLQNCAQEEEIINIVKKLKNKNGISMKDYQLIYQIQSLNEKFQHFFKNKLLYRNIMHSRLNLKVKLIYLSKISIFQESFISKKFDHIN